jgi:hypothetical protein
MPNWEPEHFSPIEMKPNDNLPEGTYTFTFYVNTGDSNRFQLMAIRTFQMTKELVKDRELHMILDDSLVSARNALADTLSQKH